MLFLLCNFVLAYILPLAIGISLGLLATQCKQSVATYIGLCIAGVSVSLIGEYLLRLLQVIVTDGCQGDCLSLVGLSGGFAYFLVVGMFTTAPDAIIGFMVALALNKSLQSRESRA